VKAGQALVDDLLDGVAAPVDNAGALRVQRATLLRQAAERIEEAFPRLPPGLLELGHGGDGGALLLLAPEVDLGAAAQVVDHLVGDVVVAACESKARIRPPGSGQ